MEKGCFVSRPCVIPTWLPCKDLSFADSFVINKGNGSVTRGLVHLTEQWNFGEPIQLNNGNVAYKMNVTSKSSVILFIDVKSRRSSLTDKELSNVNCTGFVKLIAQNMTNNSGWKNFQGKGKKANLPPILTHRALPPPAMVSERQTWQQHRTTRAPKSQTELFS